MSSQDWEPVIFNKPKQIVPNIKTSQHISKKQLHAPSNLCKELQKARTNKQLTQKQLALQLQITVNIYSSWEAGTAIPNNLQISKIEKLLQIKLPRCKLIEIEEI
jgi:ribosome-binding protein aMBF1 (putative translation factor)